jgi:hypothetical protein
MIAKALAEAKREAADKAESAGMVRLLRSADPGTFNALVLVAIGPIEAKRLGPNPTDEQLAWIGRELLALLRGEGDRPPAGTMH